MREAVTLTTPRLLLRKWNESDRAPFAAMNADSAVMEFFPGLQSREMSDASINRWIEQFVLQGWSNWAVELCETGEFIGFVGLSVPFRRLPFSPCVEIGWRLARCYWGQGYASEAATASLDCGFKQLKLNEIVSFTAISNLRSRAVMARIGMNNAQADFEHPALVEGHPLRRHCLYRIKREEFLARI